jgi:hypothetical protein
MNNLQFLPKINKATLVPMAVQPPKRSLTSIDLGGVVGSVYEARGTGNVRANGRLTYCFQISWKRKG